MRKGRRRVLGGVAVLAFATALGFAVSAGSSTSAGDLSLGGSCTMTSGCEALLGYAGATPTSPTIGAPTTVYLLGKYGIGTSPRLTVTGPGVSESVTVHKLAITSLPSGGLFAYNPQYKGPTPNAASHADYPEGCTFGISDCLLELTFTIPTKGLSMDKTYTATLTASGGDGAKNQVVWQLSFGSADTPFDPAVGASLGAVLLGSLLLFRINRRRPATAR
jgi:hypothetical protein